MIAERSLLLSDLRLHIAKLTLHLPKFALQVSQLALHFAHVLFTDFRPKLLLLQFLQHSRLHDGRGDSR